MCEREGVSYMGQSRTDRPISCITAQYVCFSRDLENWISGIGGLVSSQELADDLTGTEILIERHQV